MEVMEITSNATKIKLATFQLEGESQVWWELAHFVDDYVAIDMAKVRKFEDGLKLSIRGKIVGCS